MARPTKSGCWRVEYRPGKWCWMITFHSFGKLYFTATKELELRTRRGTKLVDFDSYAKWLPADLNCYEVDPPDGE